MNLVFLETVRASNSNLIFNKDMNVRHRRESEKTLFWIRLWHNIQCLSSDDGNFVLFLLFPINPFKVTYVMTAEQIFGWKAAETFQRMFALSTISASYIV